MSPEIQKQIDVSILFSRLVDTQDRTKAEIIRALGFISPNVEIDVEKLVPYIEYDKDPEIRMNAIFALGKIGATSPVKTKQIVPLLIKQVKKLCAKQSLELELLFEALGVIGEQYPFNSIVNELQNSLVEENTAAYSKDIAAKARYRVGLGLMRRDQPYLQQGGGIKRGSDGHYAEEFGTENAHGNILMHF